MLSNTHNNLESAMSATFNFQSFQKFQAQFDREAFKGLVALSTAAGVPREPATIKAEAQALLINEVNKMAFFLGPKEAGLFLSEKSKMMPVDLTSDSSRDLKRKLGASAFAAVLNVAMTQGSLNEERYYFFVWTDGNDRYYSSLPGLASHGNRSKLSKALADDISNQLAAGVDTPQSSFIEQRAFKLSKETRPFCHPNGIFASGFDRGDKDKDFPNLRAFKSDMDLIFDGFKALAAVEGKEAKKNWKWLKAAELKFFKKASGEVKAAVTSSGEDPFA
uniref:Uncharacterized protein n=1 Tax=Rhizoctonia cerealis bunyavirus TaxID=3068840 RepID=A0AA51BSM3_9VIRU|nr:MAG: hypothetical protein [Rhizoctonia cerealis bunyavirus]